MARCVRHRPKGIGLNFGIPVPRGPKLASSQSPVILSQVRYPENLSAPTQGIASLIPVPWGGRELYHDGFPTRKLADGEPTRLPGDVIIDNHPREESWTPTRSRDGNEFSSDSAKDKLLTTAYVGHETSPLVDEVSRPSSCVRFKQ